MYVPKGIPRKAVKKRWRAATERGHNNDENESAGGSPGEVKRALQQVPPGTHEWRADAGHGKERVDCERN